MWNRAPPGSARIRHSCSALKSALGLGPPACDVHALNSPRDCPKDLPAGKAGFSHAVRNRFVIAVMAGFFFGCAQLPRSELPVPQKIDGPPGHLLLKLPMQGAPRGASAWRVLYVSSGLSGKPIPVSGVIIIPNDPAPGPGRDVVAWAHPTTGVQDDCAPSLKSDFFKRIPGLADMLSRGFIVTATDYPGLGTPGTHPYLVGVSEGRAVLDSVRAARQLAPVSRRFAIWGHSQGGHAGLFAGQLARNYAPEFSLKGIAVAAPATDLKSLLSEDIGSEIGKVLGCYTLWSWCKIYALPQDQIFDPKDDALLNAITGTCIETLEDEFKIFGKARRLTPGFVVRNPASTEPWKSLLERNTPGAAPAGAPVYISQGTKDPIVHFDITLAFVRRLQRKGEKVHFVQLPGVRHHLAGKVSAPTAVEWIAQRFSNK